MYLLPCMGLFSFNGYICPLGELKTAYRLKKPIKSAFFCFPDSKAPQKKPINKAF